MFLTAPYKVERPEIQIYTACQRCGQAIYSTEPLCTPCLIKEERPDAGNDPIVKGCWVTSIDPPLPCWHHWLYHHFRESTLDGTPAAYIYYCQNDPHHMLAVKVKEVEWIK